MSDMSDTFGVNAPLFANSATLQRWQNIHRAQDCQMQSVITRCLNETDRRDVETRTTRHLSNRTEMTWVTCPTWDHLGATRVASSSNRHTNFLDRVRTHRRRGRGRHGVPSPARPRQPVVIHTEWSTRACRDQEPPIHRHRH